jgi:hypothetical protein
VGLPHWRWSSRAKACLRRSHAVGLAQGQRSSCGTGARRSSPVAGNASARWGLREAGGVRRRAEQAAGRRADQAAGPRAQQVGRPGEATN